MLLSSITQNLKLVKRLSKDFSYQHNQKILQATGFTVTIVSQPESVTIEHLDIIYKECMQGIHQRLFTGWNSLIQIQAESDAMLFSQSEFIEELKS